MELSSEQTLSSQQKEWDRQLIQASQFAELDNTIDAVARAKWVLADVDRVMATATSDDERENLARFRSRVEQRVASLETAHVDWELSVVERQKVFLADEQKDYDSPLHVPGVDDFRKATPS